MSHLLGPHKKYEEWLIECSKDEKPDWFDPAPPKGRTRNVYPTSTSSTTSQSYISNSKIATSPQKTSEEGKFDSDPNFTPNSKPEWYCELCHGGVSQRREVHYASVHFKDKLRKILPTVAPFICVVCHFEHKHFLNLSTHYLTQHGALRNWLRDQGNICYQSSKAVVCQ